MLDATVLFNNEERVLLNAICKNEKLSALEREDVLASLLFSRQITNDSEAMVIDLLDGAIAKVQQLTDAEWDKLKMLTPFPAVTGDEDEVPTDEDETE